MYTTADWADFRTLGTLPQKCGVRQDQLPMLVAKELADNALDAGANCRCALMNGLPLAFWVEDDGAGIPGTDEEVAELFSMARPRMSSKPLRLPTRGRLGNGLRVVAGAVFASGGELAVETRGRRLRLTPREDGTTGFERLGPSELRGTRIEVRLGDALVNEEDPLAWAKRAIGLDRGTKFNGRPSVGWFDVDAFWELCLSAGAKTVRELLAEFAGFSAAEIAKAYQGRRAAELTRDEASALLADAQADAAEVKPRRLGVVGKLPSFPGYAKAEGTFEVEPGRGGVGAEIPFVVEVWARPAADTSLEIHVNRSPVPGTVSAWERKGDLILNGCGLDAYAYARIGRRSLEIWINIQSPHVPLLSDGKSPSLEPFVAELKEALQKAIRTAKRNAPGAEKEWCSRSGIIRDVLDESIANTSDNGRLRYSERQLFYVVRPHVLEAGFPDLDYNWFCKVITDIEAERGEDLPGIFRDTRGTLYHPHTGERISLGTKAVEAYKRPAWTFSRILYIEKEGLFPCLEDARWPERNDCALLTSKGFASRAARDVLDLLGETGEELTFFCIHDADGSGTLIYQTLTEETRARAGRKVQVINLGLEPVEARAMGLQIEEFRRKGKGRVAVAGYAAAEERWLQTHRAELNAMQPAEFIEWLDRKFAPYATGGKLVPPARVLKERFHARLQDRVRGRVERSILAANDAPGRVRAELKALGPRVDAVVAELEGRVRAELDASPVEHWTAPLTRVADELAA